MKIRRIFWDHYGIKDPKNPTIEELENERERLFKIQTREKASVMRNMDSRMITRQDRIIQLNDLIEKKKSV